MTSRRAVGKRLTTSRKARLAELDALLRAELGLNVQSVLARWNIQRATLDLDLLRLRRSVGPISRSGRGRNSVYRYASPIDAVALGVAEAMSDDVQEALFRMNRRNELLKDIVKKIEGLRDVDEFGVTWILEQLKAR